MSGWIVPPPGFPVKGAAVLRCERQAKVEDLGRRGLLRSDRLRKAMLGVPREEFIPRAYRDHAYEEIPLPLPGERATISCPHSYPLFYEPLGLDEGHRFLEVGVGSGYGTALAREVVGCQGSVVAIDIDATTPAFARANLARAWRCPGAGALEREAQRSLRRGPGRADDGDRGRRPGTGVSDRDVSREPVPTQRKAAPPSRGRPTRRRHKR